MSLVESYNKANIFLGLIEYELNSLFGASHLVDYISVHIRFDLERYLLNIYWPAAESSIRIKNVASEEQGTVSKYLTYGVNCKPFKFEG